MKPTTRVRKHPFVHDPAVPADQHDREYCARCGCPGAAGDQRHLTQDEVAQQRRDERRRVGDID